jgi:hypothetical protein
MGPNRDRANNDGFGMNVGIRMNRRGAVPQGINRHLVKLPVLQWFVRT